VITMGKRSASMLFVAFLIVSYLCIHHWGSHKDDALVTLNWVGTIGLGWKTPKGH